MTTRHQVLGFFLGVALSACASPDEDEFDRKPVVTTVQAGPFRHRFYASPTSTGGAATQFRYGETVYFVNTFENTSGEDVVCRLKSQGMLVYSCPPATRTISDGGTVLWSDDPGGLRICDLAEPVSDWYPESFTIPAGFKLRSPIEVKRREPLPQGILTLRWRIDGVDELSALCGYASESTTNVTLRIEIE